MKSYRRLLLGVSWKEKNANELVRDKIKECCRREVEEVVDAVKRMKFWYFGHLVRGGGLGRQMMKGKMEGTPRSREATSQLGGELKKVEWAELEDVDKDG